jgi:hypothetical protein
MFEGIAEHLMPWLEGKWAPPYRIHIFPTDLCNLRCISCWRWAVSEDGSISWLNEEVPDERWLNLVDEGFQLGVKEWELSGGGEPMVKKELSLKLMEKIKNLGMRGEITTNFTLFNESILDFLIDIEWDRIIVSLDGPDSTINDFLRPPAGTFDKIYANLKYLQKKKRQKKAVYPLITIQCVLSKVNISSVEKMIGLAAEVEAMDIMFEVVKKFSPRCEHLMLHEKDYIRNESFLKKACEKASQLGVSTNLGSLIDTPQLVTYVGKMDKFFKERAENKEKFLSLPCYEPWSRLFISSIGTCAPCCLAIYYEEENIKHKSLLDIWLSTTFMDFRRHILNKTLPANCKQCNATLIGHSNLIRKTLKSLLKEKSEVYSCKRINIIDKSSLDFNLSICLVSREFPPETDWGGIGRYTYLLAKGLVKRGHQVHVITQTFQDEEYDYMEEGIQVHRIKHPEIFKARKPFEELARRLEYSWRVYRKIMELIDKYNIDIVEGPNFSAECFIYSLFKKTPLVTRVHTPYEEVIKNFGWKWNWDRKLSCMLEEILLRRSDMVTFSTSIYARSFIEKMNLNSKIRVIPLGIEISDAKQREDRSSEMKPLNVLFVGRLEKRKGIHILFEVIPTVIEKLKQVEFTIVGRDTFFQQDEKSFKSPEGKNFRSEFYEKLPPEIKGKVHLVGEVDKGKLEEYYKNCDVFVAPSLHETFGFVYLEAMSYGKPVIGCKVGGVPEVIKDSETGFLVEPGNSYQLAEAIVKILKDPKLRFEMGINARRRVMETFGLKNMVAQTEELYSSLISEKCN